MIRNMTVLAGMGRRSFRKFTRQTYRHLRWERSQGMPRCPGHVAGSCVEEGKLASRGDPQCDYSSNIIPESAHRWSHVYLFQRKDSPSGYHKDEWVGRDTH